jgi:DNA helicase-2/ATP-dependent DNA helicase PcrA
MDEDIARALANMPAAQAALVVDTTHGRRRYLLGPRTALDVHMLDWRTAPLAEAFFRYAPGEAYEIETDGHTAAGTVRASYVVVSRSPLVLHTRDAELRDGEIHPVPTPAPVGGVPHEIAALPVLDVEQQRAVDLPADVSLVLDGEAGVGKTLVALYRVALLQRRARGGFRALVLVPTEGLRRLCRLLADRLGILRLDIAVIDNWLIERARKAFPGLPERTSEGASAQVIALKRHPGVRAVCDDFVGWKPPRDDEKLPRSRARLLHLFGDRDRLARIVAASGDGLPERAIQQTMLHTRIQFETTTERAHRHVDADRLVALDGRALDAGTPMEDARTFDVEDVPVLFELARRGALPAVELPSYHHVVIDEAQLRSPLEIAAIGDALTPHGTATIAGDHRQATDETAYFTGWGAVRAELRRARWAETTLAVTYRSVPAIADFARAITAGIARVPDEPPPDPAVWASACAGSLGQAAALCWNLDALRARDAWRQIAVISRTPEHARRLHGELSRGLDPVLVLDGDFRFEPGIVVTTAVAVSGLEFDCVVIPDLSPSFYPATPELARSLYVAATRARDWLWLTTPETWSPLVSPA